MPGIQGLEMRHDDSVTVLEVRRSAWVSVGYKQAVGVNAFFLRVSGGPVPLPSLASGVTSIP